MIRARSNVRSSRPDQPESPEERYERTVGDGDNLTVDDYQALGVADRNRLYKRNPDRYRELQIAVEDAYRRGR